MLTLGLRPLTIEDVALVARESTPIEISAGSRALITLGRARLDDLLARGERIYGVNTGIGGNIGISLAPDQMDLLQHNIVRQLSCATGQPLPGDVVRSAALLRIVTFLSGASAVRVELAESLAALLNSGVTPVVPRYGSVGASGDLMPSAYLARALAGLGEADYGGRRLPAFEALHAAGLAPLRFAPKEALALTNGTTFMTAIAALLHVDSFRVLKALLSAIALAVEATQSPDLPFHPWIHQQKGHPGQIAVAAYLLALLEGSQYIRASGGQSCYSLRCPPQGLGQVWEALHDSRAAIEREINSANDNPLIDPATGALYKAGNFYGGHISRLLDTWKLDFAAMGNWGNSLMALLVDDRFNGGLPANLTPEPGVNSGFKGMQLSVTSLCCAIRQMAGPSSIHSVPTEQYNQDVVSLGMHAAVTALDALECLRNQTAMLLLATAQAVDLRGGPAKLGAGSRRIYQQIRQVAEFQNRDREVEIEIAMVSAKIASGSVA
jgi:phenylalanine ammonia-lyase